MTIDKESLRPAFERRLKDMWHCDELGLEPDGNGGYRDPDVAIYWAWWCAAFESLGEPVAYKTTGYPIYSYTDYEDFRGSREECHSQAMVLGWTPLYRLPEVKP